MGLMQSLGLSTPKKKTGKALPKFKKTPKTNNKAVLLKHAAEVQNTLQKRVAIIKEKQEVKEIKAAISQMKSPDFVASKTKAKR